MYEGAPSSIAVRISRFPSAAFCKNKSCSFLSRSSSKFCSRQHRRAASMKTRETGCSFVVHAIHYLFDSDDACVGKVLDFLDVVGTFSHLIITIHTHTHIYIYIFVIPVTVLSFDAISRFIFVGILNKAHDIIHIRYRKHLEFRKKNQSEPRWIAFPGLCRIETLQLHQPVVPDTTDDWTGDAKAR